MRLTRPQDEHQRIFIYSDLIQPQITGNKTKGLLREIILDNTASSHSFQLYNLIHLPTRKSVFDNIEIEMKDVDDNDIQFHQVGVSSVTLMFSRRCLR